MSFKLLTQPRFYYLGFEGKFSLHIKFVAFAHHRASFPVLPQKHPEVTHLLTLIYRY